MALLQFFSFFQQCFQFFRNYITSRFGRGITAAIATISVTAVTIATITGSIRIIRR